MKNMIKWQKPYDKVHPKKIDEYFESSEEVALSLSDLLLNNKSTAIFHVDPKRTRLMGGGGPRSYDYMEFLLLGVNYHYGHSEGDYKIVVQNIPQRKGPYVLFRPPGSKETTFYLQHLVFPRLMKPEFEEDVANPLKIEKFYLFRGNLLSIFDDFKGAGFRFVDQPMSEEHYNRLEELSLRNNKRYNTWGSELLK